jgi:hypothetical protein
MLQGSSRDSQALSADASCVVRERAYGDTARALNDVKLFSECCMLLR